MNIEWINIKNLEFPNYQNRCIIKKDKNLLENLELFMGVKWGVLGTASIAENCTIPGMLKAEDCELYAIAGRDEDKTLRFQEQFGFEKSYVGYDALIQDSKVQAVYIPLPNGLHYEWVIKALQAGKHVLCEKPLALSAKDAQTMYQVAKEQGVVLTEAFAYLHSPYVKSLKEDIDSGMIGDIDYIETAFLTQGYTEDIRLYKELGGGAMYDLGCYCTTMILSLVDSEPVYVRASAEMSEKGVDLFTAGIIKFENNVRASFNIGMMFHPGVNGRFDRLYIHGTKGQIRSDVEYNQEGDFSYTILADGKRIERRINAKQNYCLEVEHMNRMIQGKEKSYITPEFSIKNAKLIDAVLNDIGY